MKKSPLDGLMETLKNMTPEEKAKWQEETTAKLKKMREDDERKANEPPKTPTGKCVFCGGLVKGEHVHGLRPGTDSRFVPIGPGSRSYYTWIFKGYHCTQCGLVYKFPPPERIVTQQGDANEATGFAQADQGRGRSRPRRGRQGKEGPAEVVRRVSKAAGGSPQEVKGTRSARQ